MKRLTRMLSALLALLLLLSACGSPAEPLPQESPAASESDTPAPESEAVTETESETETETETEPTTEAVTETEPATEAATETEPATEAATETEPATEAATETEPATEAATEADPATEAATEAEPATEAATEAEPATEAATETDPATEAVTETDPATEAVTETDPAAEAETTPPADQKTYPELTLGKLPAYVGARNSSETFNVGDNSQMLYVKGAKETDFHNYCATLADAGWERYATHEAANNLFATYINDSRIATVYFMARNKEIRIIEDPLGPLAPRAEDVEPYETVCEPMVRLVGQSFFRTSESEDTVDNGLYMIFRLSDGRLIVVDGGFSFDTVPSWFMDNLREMAPDPRNITIAAWIVTHAHGDHVDGFLSSITYTGAPFTIDQVIMNVPDVNATPIDDKDVGSVSRIRNWMGRQNYTDIVKTHTGQVFHYADATVEMLYTFEDCLPRDLDEFNTTSLICRVTLGGQTIMVLGDCSERASGILVKNYGNYMKSDIVQLAHHGYLGGTPTLYQMIKAPVLLWPSGWEMVPSLAKRSYNKAAINIATDIFVAANIATDLPLPYTPVGNKATALTPPDNWIANSPK